MKSWRPVIERHIQVWSGKLGSLSWWPTYVYHVTDVKNAVSILHTGTLYSRRESTRQRIMQVDNASPEVIQQTHRDYHRYVRFYFRPQTPTSFRNEGIRPLGQRELGGAHCPVPVYFCFDALDILSRDDCEFSDGNMASPKARHGGDEQLFSSIPFGHVFHRGWMPPETKDDIRFRRCAEVLIPDHLQLDHSLKTIVCRSSAELQTLKYLLQENVYSQWGNRIRIAEIGERFFERKWTFIDEVVPYDGDKINFRFNPDTQTPGPFHVQFTYRELGSNIDRTWEGNINSLNGSFVMRVKGANLGVATLTLDDSLAYAGIIIFSEIPF